MLGGGNRLGKGNISAPGSLGSGSLMHAATAGAAQSSDATLSGLTISAGSLSPAFSGTVTSYTVSETNATTTVTVTPTANEAHATIQVRVNGGSYASVTSGQASGNLSLNVGANTIDILVTAQNSYAQTYTTTATRAASANANLSGMTIAAGTLAPAFGSSTHAYTATITYVTVSDTVTPTAADGGATIQARANSGSYTAVTSGQASGTLTMNVGSNTIDVLVTAADAVTLGTYTTTVTRTAASTDATLSAMTLSSGTLTPTFNAGTFTYTASVANTVTADAVTPTSNGLGATIQTRANGGTLTTVTSGQASGSYTMNVGTNTINVLVTAQDGSTTGTYTTTVTRASAFASTNSMLWGANNNTAFIRTVGTNAGQAFGSVFTANVWVKAASSTSLDMVVALKGDGFNGCVSWYIANRAAKLVYAQGTAGVSSATAFDSTWHMVTTSFNNGTVIYYVDGAASGSATGAPNPPAACSKPFQIGGYTNPGNVTNGYVGNMTHMSLWNAALSASEVGELRSGGKPADLSTHSKVANLASWYYLGDGDATGAGNVIDHSSNAYHATINGSVSVVADTP